MTGIVPLGDQAVLAYFADEAAALRFAAAARREAPTGLVDVVQAYASVALFFDPERCDFTMAAESTRRLAERSDAPAETERGRLHFIPCCYERGPDLERVAAQTGLTTDEVIRLHAETEYVVYAIGFCPGFPYLGYLPPSLCGVPRLPAPRLRVEAGSVGMTGRQTGVYTLPRPGGWNLVGQTPLMLVDVTEEYFPIRTGDRVQFQRIDEAEYRRLEGERL
jgi:inhibitor of KinA